MLIIKQDDYDRFQCIAGACPKSCCEGWQIVIDKEALEEYEETEGTFRRRLMEGIDWEEGAFSQNGRRCSMLNAQGLCDLQLALGEQALCYTCDMYPRHMEEYRDVREYSLSLSCPEAARMVVMREEPYHFLREEYPGYDDPEDYEDFDDALYERLVESREEMYQLAQDRSFSIWERCKKIMDAAYEIQLAIEKGLQDDSVASQKDKEDNMGDAKDLMEDSEDKSLIRSLCQIRDKSASPELRWDIDPLYELEHLEPDWIDRLERAGEYLSHFSAEAGRDDRITLSQREEIALEQILMMLLYTYYTGAVYDDEVYAKAGLCVCSVIWIAILYRSQYPTEDLTGLQQVVYLYAREVEHSDRNLDRIEEMFILHGENQSDEL